MRLALVSMCFLFLLMSCAKPCPDGFVPKTVGGERVCISALVYCEDDVQCSSARYDCDDACDWRPVNSLFSVKAHERSNLCDASKCPQVPRVRNWCENNRCMTETFSASDEVPLPRFLEVFGGMQACYEDLGDKYKLRLRVDNNSSKELTQLEAKIFLANGSYASANLLSDPIPAREVSDVSYKFWALPINMSVRVVRPVNVQGMVMGVRNEEKVARVSLSLCEG